jgi:hypothetical protein
MAHPETKFTTATKSLALHHTMAVLTSGHDGPISTTRLLEGETIDGRERSKHD